MPNPPKSKLATLANTSVLTAAIATLSRSELAARLGISVDTLDRLHKRGAGPPRLKLPAKGHQAGF